jgi:hypothetical protein
MKMKPDFEISGTMQVHNDAELREALAAGGPVRLAGTGSQQHLVPAPTTATAVRMVSLASMDRILRLEADDLTCTVEAGVRREALDAALAEHQLQLPCAGSGTLGGLFATDLVGPLGPGMHSPRSLLLGFEGLLAEGLSFKAGARVVKSVAGFDLQKLFVGSQGRLFAATRLHLKLRPAARHQASFRHDDVELFDRLRLLPTPPTCLLLHKPVGSQGPTVHGTLAGPRPLVEGLIQRHGLTRDEATPPLLLEPSSEEEILQGSILCSRIRELVSRLPQNEVLATGGGRFQVRVDRNQADEVLASVQDLAPDTWILCGAAERRGQPCSDGNGALQKGLKQALDPNQLLA